MTTDITPSHREYVNTLACPEAIHNVLNLIDQRLAVPGAENHTHLMFEYDLKWVSPSSRFLSVIDKILENRGINWRIYSTHLIVAREVVRIILRKASLIDLTTNEVPLEPYEMELSRIMAVYSKQYNQPLIEGPSNITVFRVAENQYYWVYTRIFDMWEYNDQFPEVGWKEIL